MGWLSDWLHGKPALSAQQQQRLAAWHALPAVSRHALIGESRCVVVDVETSGLNLMQDRLISIGAIAVRNGKIALGDSFYVVLQQAAVSDKHNILLHGIGGTAQIDGVPAADALLDFLHFIGKDPLIAFHVTFDQTMIQRALRHHLGCVFKHPWSDMAYVMPALNPSLARRYRSLDDWITHFAIVNDARHNALSDALVTAQLFQRALAQAKSKHIADFSQLRDLEQAQRWVSSID